MDYQREPWATYFVGRFYFKVNAGKQIGGVWSAALYREYFYYIYEILMADQCFPERVCWHAIDINFNSDFWDCFWCMFICDITTIYELPYIRNPAVNRALCVLLLASFFLWMRFPLC